MGALVDAADVAVGGWVSVDALAAFRRADFWRRSLSEGRSVGKLYLVVMR